LHLEIAAGKRVPLQLPVVADTLMRGVEVLAVLPPDTTDLGNDRMLIRCNYRITSFDEALYMLPALPVVAGGDTVYSNRMALKVSTLPVDTESGNFYDIKDIWQPAFVLADYAVIFYAIFGVCVLILGILYWVFRRKKIRPASVAGEEPKEVLPPHVRAIRELDAIKGEKLWQAGREKEYHSQLSDVVRTYIDGRFGISAMEMTSGEILQLIRGKSEAGRVFDRLKQLLLLADLAKFAKYRPLPDENELSLMHAYLFVHETTPVQVSSPSEENENKDENDDAL
jgi:hypothetical protein